MTNAFARRTAPGEYTRFFPSKLVVGEVEYQPQFFNVASDEELSEIGVYRVDVTPPEGQRWTQVFADDGGLPVAVFETRTLTGDDVNAERDRRIVAGKTFTVDGYGDVPLTGREEDKVALMGLLVKAQGAKALGVTAAVMKLRGGANTTHMLTPDQMISLISAGMSWIEATMSLSWDMKDGVAPFESGIPADYTDDAYWP